MTESERLESIAIDGTEGIKRRAKERNNKRKQTLNKLKAKQMNLLISTRYDKWKSKQSFFNTCGTLSEVNGELLQGIGLQCGIRGHVFTISIDWKDYGTNTKLND